MRLQAALLPGGRLHLQDGPIDVVITAEGSPAAVTAAYSRATRRAATILDELCAERPLLRTHRGARATGTVARAMQDAVRPYEADGFITPMAAVAGAVATTILAACCVFPQEPDITRAIVNNGGDIAIFLAPGQRLTAGMAARPEDARLFGTLALCATDVSRGIATSGFGGRSDTFGIADAVTILARDAAMADAAATIVANAVDLPGHPAIRRGPSLRAQSDLGDRAVTHAVGPLPAQDVAAALQHGADCARKLLARGLIDAAALHLRGQTIVIQAPSFIRQAA